MDKIELLNTYYILGGSEIKQSKLLYNQTVNLVENLGLLSNTILLPLFNYH